MKLLTDSEIFQTLVIIPVADNGIKQNYIVTIQDINELPIIYAVPTEASVEANIVLNTSVKEYAIGL